MRAAYAYACVCANLIQERQTGGYPELAASGISPKTHDLPKQESRGGGGADDDLLDVKVTGGSGLKKVSSLKSIKSEMFDVRPSKVFYEAVKFFPSKY